MRGRLLAVAAILVLAVPGLLLAKGIDLYSMFPNLTLGSDPNGLDNVYVSCAGITATTLTMQVHVVTDNADPNDAIQGIDVRLALTADQPGVTLDTTVATVFGGSSAVATWDNSTKAVGVVGNDPTVFPMDLTLGAVEQGNNDPGGPLGPGDYVFATLKFNVSSPTNISASGTTINSQSTTLVTTLANGYTVQVTGETCGPIVPTLTEWGLILFGVILFGSMVWYLRRRPVTAAA